MYVNADSVYIEEIPSSVAKKMIIEKHYTHAFSMCRYALGIYYQMDEKDIFGNDLKLIGCAIYGFPVGAKASTSVCEGLSKDNILELTRLYVDDGYGSNIESKLAHKISELYPDDNAYNYKIGDIRGAFSVKIPLKN